MQTIAVNFDDQKKEIELSIARTILAQIETQTISYDQSQEIARYVLFKIDGVKSGDQLLLFLQDLAGKWQFFETIAGLYRLKIGDAKQTQQKLEETKDKLEEIAQSN